MAAKRKIKKRSTSTKKQVRKINKNLIFVFIIFVILVQLLSLLAYKYYRGQFQNRLSGGPVNINDLPNPKFETQELTVGYSGKEYSSDVIATIFYDGDIKLEFFDLPPGLSAENCNSQRNLEILPKLPNSVSGCQIRGVVAKPGNYPIEATATVLGLNKKTNIKYNLLIVKE